MTHRKIDNVTLALLKARVGKWHLKQRLGIEQDYEVRVFGQGRKFFHIENWYSVHSLIRNSLRLCMLHKRGKRNARAIQVRHNHIQVPGLPSVFEDYTLLHISDMHLDMADDIPNALIEVVRQVDYDVCVMTGDMRAATFGPYDAVLAAMKQVRVHLNGTVYGVLGNHDSICMVPGLEALDIQMLLNEVQPLRRGDSTIYLAGIDDAHYYRADNLEQASESIPENAISILLSHTPEIYRHAAHTEFNIMLCGHTHGGQICLPGGFALTYNTRCPRALSAGSWQFKQLVGYTSVGSGVCVVDVRLNCPPEITLHHLHCG